MTTMKMICSHVRPSSCQRFGCEVKKASEKSWVGKLYYRKKQLWRQSEKKGSLCRRVLKHPKHGHFIRNANFLQTNRNATKTYFYESSTRVMYFAHGLFGWLLSWWWGFDYLPSDNALMIMVVMMLLPDMHASISETWPIVAAGVKTKTRLSGLCCMLPIPICIFKKSKVYPTILWEVCEVGEKLSEFANGQTLRKLTDTYFLNMR